MDIVLYTDQELAARGPEIADGLISAGHRVTPWSKADSDEIAQAAVALLGRVPDLTSDMIGKTPAETLVEGWAKDGLPVVVLFPDPEIAPDADAWQAIRQNLSLVDARNALQARLRGDTRYAVLYLSGAGDPKDPAAATCAALEYLAARRSVQREDRTFIARMPDLHTPYRYPLHNEVFVGRQADLNALTEWAQQDERPVCALIAMGGSGKSALAWRWITKTAQTLKNPFEGIFWWDFYHDSDAEKCAAQLMAYLTAEPLKIFLNRSFPANIDALQSHLNGRRVLICLDGVERILNHYREFDVDAHDALGAEDDDRLVEDRFRACARQEGPLLRALLNMHKSKALLTSRLLPLDLERNGAPHPGLKQIDKLQMTWLDARALMDKFDVRASDAVLDHVTTLVAGHPLALRALAGAVKSDHGGDLDAWSAKTRGVEIAGLNLVVRRSHILRHALAGVSARSLALLGAAAAFRGPAALDDIVSVLLLEADLLTSEDEVRTALRDLRARQLLFLDEKNSQCDMHPLVRGTVWKGLTQDWKETLAERHGTYFFGQQPERDLTSAAGFAALQHLWFSLLERRRRDEAFEALEPYVHEHIIHHGRAIDIARMFDVLREDAERANEPIVNLPDNRRECLFWQAFTLSYSGRTASAGQVMLDALEDGNKTPDSRFKGFRHTTRLDLIADLANVCQSLALHSTGLSVIDHFGSGRDISPSTLTNFRTSRAILTSDLGDEAESDVVLFDISRDHTFSESSSWTFFRLDLALGLAASSLLRRCSEAKTRAALLNCQEIVLLARRSRLREIEIRATALHAFGRLRLGTEPTLLQRSLDAALEEARRIRLSLTEAYVLSLRLRFAALVRKPDEQDIALAHSARHFGRILDNQYSFARLFPAAAHVLGKAGERDAAADFARRGLGYSLQPDGSIAYAKFASECQSILTDLAVPCDPISPLQEHMEQRAELQHRIQTRLLQ